MYSNKFKYFLFLSCFIALPVIGEIPHFFSLSISKKKAPLSTKKKAKLPIKKSFPKVLKKYSSTNEPFLVEVLAKNLGIVWGMVFINEKELLFTERKGHIKKLHIETGKITNISGAPKVYAKGQGGLLDITLHPYFSKNKKSIYILCKTKR